MISWNQFTWPVILCIAIAVNSVSCHSAQNANSSKRNQIIHVNGNEVAVISCYFTQPGGTFYFITKSNDG